MPSLVNAGLLNTDRPAIEKGNLGDRWSATLLGAIHAAVEFASVAGEAGAAWIA